MKNYLIVLSAALLAACGNADISKWMGSNSPKQDLAVERIDDNSRTKVPPLSNIQLVANSTKEQHIAEAQDVKFFAIEEKNMDGSPVLRIKGLIFHSAISVKKVHIQKNGDTTSVLIAMTPAMPGLSGAFDISIPLAGNVNTVLFGKAGAPIWRKEMAGKGAGV
ncbi:MAG: hypothetical protein V4724_39175 [Pseudomonadota bacterium]